MHMTGEEFIAAPRQTVWRALNDPEVLRRCIPGCQEIRRQSDTELEATVQVKVGPVKAHFNGEVTLLDLDPPNSYRIEGKGKGFVGLATGGATVRLADAPGGTNLSYEAEAQVAGKLASLGARLIDSTATQLAQQFFERFATEAQAMGDGSSPPQRAAKKPTAKKPAAKKPAAKKPAAKKPVAKKPVAKSVKRPVAKTGAKIGAKTRAKAEAKKIVPKAARKPAGKQARKTTGKAARKKS